MTAKTFRILDNMLWLILGVIKDHSISRHLPITMFKQMPLNRYADAYHLRYEHLTRP